MIMTKNNFDLSRLRHFFAVLILLLFVMGNVSLSAKEYFPDEMEMKDNSIIAVKELYDAFKKDEKMAKEKYVGKTMTIKGFVVYTGPDVYALPSVELSEKKGGKSRSLCVLPFSDYLKLRKVSKGDEVVITGEVRGFYQKGDQVLMKQCVIVEENKK